jgi:tyrosyl-tRNA synthetase
MSDLLDRLSERGFVQDLTPGLRERLAEGPITAYIGFDPTADSLHVGSLVPVMGLAWLQKCGGTPIPLLGGGTGMVGDPSGKRTERPILSVEQIDANLEGIRRQLERFLSFKGATAARMRNNADWLRKLLLMEFLRDTGKHFTLSYMLQKESVRSRLETGISYTEFSYMLTQAYDFWHLWRHEGCELQMGGSDQWGNITAGCELVARREGAQVHGLVFPLLETASGSKFGKSEVGNVWLDKERTKTPDFYKFWYNTDDRDVERFLKLFTFLELEEIKEALRQHHADPSKRVAQDRLAQEVTRAVHGEEEMLKAQQAMRALFGDEAFSFSAHAALLKQYKIPSAEFGRGLSLVDALVLTELASSKSDARRGIQGKGYYVNEQRVSDVDLILTWEHVERDSGGIRYVRLRKGKKNHAVLVVE